MKATNNINESFIRAKDNVKKLKIFYIHLVGYLVLVALISWNLAILEGEYKSFMFWMLISILVGWTIFIALHGWFVFKGRFFSKHWEYKKMKDFMDNEQKK